jgi:cytochrome c-type biogenesis protein CcsB
MGEKMKLNYFKALFVMVCFQGAALLGLSTAGASQNTIYEKIKSTHVTAGQQLKYMPVQDAGRIKPFDTFAREVLEIVYGKQKFKFENKPAVDAYIVIFTWMLTPEAWRDQEVFEVKNSLIKKALDLEVAKNRFKGDIVFGNDKFQVLMQELREKRDSKEKLTPYFQALQRLETQFFLFREIASGRWLRVKPDLNSKKWLSVADLDEQGQKLFIEISRKFAESVAKPEAESQVLKDFDNAVLAFIQYAETADPAQYAQARKVTTEVFYNDLHPFRWTYIIYLIAAIFLLLAWINSKPIFTTLGWVLSALGFLVHTYGFAIRVYLSERPPVSNMYETVVWVAWGVIIFAAILERVYKFRFILLIGLLTGIFSMVVADSAPAVLDPTLQPLEAVLRSNYWLIVHVMTITISYAAFLLAFGLGDLGLFYYLKGEEKNKEKIKAIALATYRSMQIGVAFLTPGIILGGIWADYSWGRFWGWDPKETWALIALLGYLAVLHGRLVGWVKDFEMLASGIITFSLVIMAWYGVNFVLGAGLHSYGFGAGGLEYVSGFVVLHFAYVLYVYIYRKTSKA